DRAKRAIPTPEHQTPNRFRQRRDQATCARDINETLEDVNVFLYSPVIESGVGITVNVKKVYGLLSSKSSSQRAFQEMINRCRCVEDPRID
ncbi:MAG: hypothetical protein ACKPKO_60560, partial [Candidatus Fonsibacter sp.]